MERITRTIKKTSYKCLVYNLVDHEMTEQNFMLDKEFDRDTARKILGKKFNGDTITVVDVISTENIEQLYEISLEDFLKYAKPVQPKEKDSTQG